MKLSQAQQIISASVESNMTINGWSSKRIVPMLWGIPGLGKSTIVRAVAEALGIDCIVINLAEYDAGELAGYPMLKDGEMVRSRPRWLPVDGKGVLFLDELVQAPVANQNVARQLVNDGRIGEHLLGDGWSVVCAGNDLSNRAGTNAMPSHMKDALLHIDVEPFLDESLRYFNTIGANPMITGFLAFSPEHLSMFNKDVKACPSPRSWEKADQILGMGLDSEIEFHALCGTLGAEASAKFKAFQQVYRELPDPELPLRDPMHAPIPSEPSVMYAVVSAIAYRVNKENASNFCAYMQRLPEQEFSAFGMKTALDRFNDLRHEKAFQQWAIDGGADLVVASRQVA